MFVDLHLSNHYGAPMYPVENGFYHITNSSKETAINYLRITETEYNLLYQAEDKQYFKYLLYTLGIVERWKRESNEAIKKLEELTGQIWENPYKPENERFTLKLTDEERTISQIITPTMLESRVFKLLQKIVLRYTLTYI
jgi:hypothetical protein